mgnify:CR=1 FL=1
MTYISEFSEPEGTTAAAKKKPGLRRRVAAAPAKVAGAVTQAAGTGIKGVGNVTQAVGTGTSLLRTREEPA